MNQTKDSESAYARASGGNPEDTVNGAGNNSDSQLHSSPATSYATVAKAPRKRNKPSLSCETCTVKKTKCDRSRPSCFACLKRKTECHYSQLANLIEESQHSPAQHPQRRKSKSQGSNASKSAYVERRHGSIVAERAPSRSSTGSSPRLQGLLSNIPFTHPTVSNLFKAEHPFR